EGAPVSPWKVNVVDHVEETSLNFAGATWIPPRSGLFRGATASPMVYMALNASASYACSESGASPSSGAPGGAAKVAASMRTKSSSVGGMVTVAVTTGTAGFVRSRGAIATAGGPWSG